MHTWHRSIVISTVIMAPDDCFECFAISGKKDTGAVKVGEHVLEYACELTGMIVNRGGQGKQPPPDSCPCIVASRAKGKMAMMGL